MASKTINDNCIDKLFNEAEKKGEKSDDHKYYRSENGEFGKDTDIKIHTQEKGNLKIKAISKQVREWSPGGDYHGNEKVLEIYKNGNMIFTAELDEGGSIDLFSAGEERFEGSKKVEKNKKWRITKGKNLKEI